MSIDPNTPVIVGAAQHTVHRGQQPGPEPLAAWAESLRLAAEDAGISPSELRNVQFLAVADCFGWEYDDPVGRLADKLSATPRGRYQSKPSGTAGHVMLAKASAAIRSGQAEIAAITGGECNATRRAYLRAGEPLPWSYPKPPEAPALFNLVEQQHPGESAIGLFEGVGAVYTFAMRDIARRAHLGVSPDAYRRQLGELMSGMTKVAAANPHAWFPEHRDPDFLIDPRPDNRLIAYPYTKHMVSIMDVDIAAGLIVMSEAKADALGIPREKRVYPWAMCYANDPDWTAVRPNLWKSEAMAAASEAVTRAAGITADQIKHLDFYSCFPAAVNFARDALGVSERPGEQMTVTGGLPYGGGPGSSYVVTSLAKMTHRLRKDPDNFGLVSGLGMMMANHAYGLYSARPPEKFKPIDEAAVQAEVDKTPQVPITSDYTGPVTVTTYTVMYDRNGDRTHGAGIVDLPNGARSYVRILDPDLLREAEETELVGRRLHMVGGEHAGELLQG